MLSDESYEHHDRKMQHVVMMICNYLLKNVKIGGIYRNTWLENDYVDMCPIYEYISLNKIDLFEYSQNELFVIDMRNDADVERFILSYICSIVKRVT
jgi:hypothetical protein